MLTKLTRRQLLTLSVVPIVGELFAASKSSAVTPVLEPPISDLYILVGANSVPPPGYIKIDQDLNEGAGGDYIYLCYKRGGPEPITALFVAGFDDSDAVDEILGYTRLATDLNQDAGGRYLYLYYSRLPQLGEPISDLYLGSPKAGSDAYVELQDMNEGAGGKFVSIYYARTDKRVRHYPKSQVDVSHFISNLLILHGDDSRFRRTPRGYVRIPTDLNLNAGGDYIYLCYKRGGPLPITALWVGSFPDQLGIDWPYTLPGYRRMSQDLNQGAGGRFIHLYYSVLPELGPPITDLVVGEYLYGDLNPGLKVIAQNLNEDAGGTVIRLGYRS